MTEQPHLFATHQPLEQLVERPVDLELIAAISKRLAENTHCQCGCGRGLTSIAERIIGRNECCLLPESVVRTSAWGPILEGCPFSLLCEHCDAEAELLGAIDAGWRDINHHCEGLTYFQGVCPECVADEENVGEIHCTESEWRGEQRLLVEPS